MDINEPSESEESNNSLHSLSRTTSSSIFHNTGNNNIKDKGFYNRFMSFCETNILNNVELNTKEISEDPTNEENLIEQFLDENTEKPINNDDDEKGITENAITNENDFLENPLDGNNLCESVIENDFIENSINVDFIENTINEHNFIKKLMTEDDFIDKFLKNTAEKNAIINEKQTKKITKSNSTKKVTNVTPKRENAGIEKPKSVKTTKTKANKNGDEANIEQKGDAVCLDCTSAAEPVAHIKLEVLDKLKISTRKLIELLEEIQLKTHSNPETNLTMEKQDLADIIRSMPDDATVPPAVDIAVNSELKKLQQHTKSMDAIHVENEKDNCSVYKRLTRKCVCMNRTDFNDFIIHFNEDSKFFTTNTGEIIKNLRILKKFMYIGAEYSKRAFMFLNEGLSTSNQVEKIEIMQGCSHADVCNIFEEHSIVITSISWLCKSENYGNLMTQSLAVSILHKMAQIEEGRRYLNYTSKILNDIKKVLRKKSTFLPNNLIETLNLILNLLQPPMVEHIGSVTYYCKAVEEGFGFKTVAALAHYRQYLTLEEVFIHLDLLHNLSKTDCGKNELRKILPAILSVFRNLLFEFDNSEMNIILTNILNNIISRNFLNPSQNPPKSAFTPKLVVMAETITDEKEMKDESIQTPFKKHYKSKSRSRSEGFFMSTTKIREPSRRKIWQLSPKPSPPAQFSSTLRLKNNIKETCNLNILYENENTISKNQVIVVPMDKKNKLFRF